MEDQYITQSFKLKMDLQHWIWFEGHGYLEDVQHVTRKLSKQRFLRKVEILSSDVIYAITSNKIPFSNQSSWYNISVISFSITKELEKMFLWRHDYTLKHFSLSLPVNLISPAHCSVNICGWNSKYLLVKWKKKKKSTIFEVVTGWGFRISVITQASSTLFYRYIWRTSVWIYPIESDWYKNCIHFIAESKYNFPRCVWKH